jgi:hypothetical protein
MLFNKNNTIFSFLPFDLIKEILLYTNYFVLRKNKDIVFINKILKTDIRYELLKTIPKIFKISNNSWSVILGKEKKYILKHYLRPSLIWEYSYVIFSKDPHTNMMNSIPDSIIYIPLYNEQLNI